MNTKPAGSGFPFGGNVVENLEMMSKAWGAGLAQMPGFAMPSMGQTIPSMMMPTLDVNELDKRITDLRAVEQWLALNANMLRATIQTLEVQRNTIATLQTLGASMMNAPLMAQEAQAAAAAAMNAAAAPSPAPASARSPAAEAPQASGAGVSGSRRARRPAPAAEAQQSGFADMPLNPAAWWANLQDQFARIATAAAGEPAAKATTRESAPKSSSAPAEAAKDRDNRPAARKPPTRRAG